MMQFYPENTEANEPSLGSTPRKTVFALLLLGICGLGWAGFRLAFAEPPVDPNVAFLEDFSQKQQELNAELQALRMQAITTSQQSQEVEKQKSVAAKPATESRNAARQRQLPASNYFVEPLRIDLSDSAVEQRLKQDAEYLASDKLEGRGVRTRGLVLAGEYIAEQFAEAGLYTAWFNGTPFQEFHLLNESRRGAVQKVQVRRTGAEVHTLTPNVDFTSLLKTTSGTMTLPVVFVGYGITAPELNYDDYAGLRVAGKAVLILRHEPRQHDSESPFNGSEPSRHAPIFSKIQNAIAHGATAVILCDTRPIEEEVGHEDPFSSDLLKVEFAENTFDTTIPVIHCRRQLIEESFSNSGDVSLDQLEREIDESLEPRSRVLDGVSMTFEVSRDRNGQGVRNVLASIEPNGEIPSRTVIIGAHYDHLGMDSYGSLAVGAQGEIHNGADDNASGTAVIMEVARQLAARRDQLNCRILFIAFTAEELGLLGSKHYVRDPVVPLSETVAMINLDMVGRLRNEVTIYGMGTARQWKDIVPQAAQDQGLKMVGRSSGYGPSDHAVFYERGIPVLHFFTGFHPQYHRPSDDAHLLNIAGMRQISRCVTDIVAHLAHDDSELEAQSTSDDSLAALGLSGLSLDVPNERPRLGVVVRPTTSDANTETGLLIDRVMPNSLAASHGLQPGDTLLRFGDVPMTSLDLLKETIGKYSRGEKAQLTVRRRSLTLEVEIVF